MTAGQLFGDKKYNHTPPCYFSPIISPSRSADITVMSGIWEVREQEL